jgi:signal transduction histidine kinase
MNNYGKIAWVSSILQGSTEVRDLDALMAELARALVRVTIYDMDAEINRWLELIGTRLDVDRSTIAEIDPVTGWSCFTHGWARKPYPIIAQPLNVNALLPWTLRKMIAGETVVMTSPDALPAEAAIDRESFYRYGPKSSVVVPIKVGGTLVGGVSFASLIQPRSWSSETVQRFEAVAEILGCGLERKRAIAEILRLQSELNHVSRITMMGELAASLAHELNQPLAAILSNAETVQAILTSERPDLDEISAGITDIIEDNNRARDIIQRVWTLFRRDRVPKASIDVAEMLAQVRRMVQSEASARNICLYLNTSQPIPQIHADRVQIQQAIMNLILNAFDAVGSLEDRLREVRIEASTSDELGDVRILIRDSGKGIGADAMPKIFDAFFTTKPHGLGMGLAITKSIVATHGGTLSASTGYQGTTFEVRLPISEGHALLVPVQGAEEKSVVGSPKLR